MSPQRDEVEEPAGELLTVAEIWETLQLADTCTIECPNRSTYMSLRAAIYRLKKRLDKELWRLYRDECQLTTLSTKFYPASKQANFTLIYNKRENNKYKILTGHNHGENSESVSGNLGDS